MDVKPFEPFIPNENARKWADALESGEYRQGTGQLETKSGAFCCLGVACHLAMQEGVPVVRVGAHDGHDTTYDGHTGTLPDVVQEWLGLATRSGRYRADPHTRAGHRLVDDNDHEGHDFGRIAMTIRTTPTLFKEHVDAP